MHRYVILEKDVGGSLIKVKLCEKNSSRTVAVEWGSSDYYLNYEEIEYDEPRYVKAPRSYELPSY